MPNDTDLTLSTTLTSGLRLDATRETLYHDWYCKVFNPAGELMVMLSGFPLWSVEELCAWMTEHVNPNAEPIPMHGILGVP